MKTNRTKLVANSDTKSLILYIDTSEPEAVLAIYLCKGPTLAKCKGRTLLGKEKWLAHRELSATLTDKIADLLKRNDIKMSDLVGIVAYEGPGSFTGLRIGIAHANALAYALGVPIYGTRIRESIDLSKPQKIITPFYGAEPHITKPRNGK